MDSADLVEFFFQEINKLRRNPKLLETLLHDRILRLVKQQIKQRQANCYSHYQFGNVLFKTIQGERAIRDAIKYIHEQPKVRGLALSQKLCEAAYQVGLQMQKSLPREIDLSAYREFIKKTIQIQIPQIHQRVEPMIQYGFRRDIDLLTSIIIDDGNFERSRRIGLMSEVFKSIGISVHQHNEFDYFVIFLLSTYEEPVGCRCEIM